MNDDDKLIQNLQREVKKSQRDLDAETLGKLRAARRTALESINQNRITWWRRPVTRYTLSSTIAIALMVSILFPLFTVNNHEFDVEVAAISEDIELLEDLDFYLWIIDSVENES